MSPIGFTYSGISVAPREVSFEVEFHGTDGAELFRAVQSEREVRLTLAAGQRWPNYVRRGRAVDVTFDLGDRRYRLSGEVRFRRLSVAVIQGQVRAAPALPATTTEEP